MVGVAALHAQGRTVTANVPFAFYAGSSVMPEGAYRVELNNNGVMYLRATDKDAAKILLSWTLDGKDDGRQATLVFHRYGDLYFLSQVWTNYGSTGRAVGVTEREKELERGGTATLAVVRVALH